MPLIKDTAAVIVGAVDSYSTSTSCVTSPPPSSPPNSGHGNDGGTSELCNSYSYVQAMVRILFCVEMGLPYALAPDENTPGNFIVCVEV
jgi:hypothetical protein